MLSSTNLLGVKITNETEEKVLEYVLKRLKNSKKKFFITTPNPEIISFANSHPAYKDKLNQAEVALPDGVGIMLAAKFMGKTLKSRITGTDFIEKLCKVSREKPISMGFLGGRGGVAERTAERLKKKYPWIKIGFVGEEWSTYARGPVGSYPRPTSSASPAGARRGTPTPATPRSSFDILFVAYGFPKQEEWIYENLEKLPVTAAMGIGGAFDYISGEVIRAPLFFRKLGLEWLFRLLSQPWRFGRQLALVKFIFLVIKEKLK
jgi:N-acetylglucosaminyldiphosphoundecaprenol N-acetyl-beta-D-mannosaminyltransferase